VPDPQSLREEVEAIAGVLNFFIPFEVVSGIGLVFAMENIVDSWLATGEVPMIWLQIYLVFAIGIGIITYLGADEDELEELADDLEEITN